MITSSMMGDHRCDHYATIIATSAHSFQKVKLPRCPLGLGRAVSGGRRSSTQQRAPNQFFNHFRADHSGPFIQNWYMVPDRTVLGVLLSPIVPMAMLPSIRMQCQCIAEGRELMQNIPNDWMHANNSCESENIVNGLGLCKPMSSRPIDERLLFTFSLMKSF